MVVYQSVGLGCLPISPKTPLRWLPFRITDQRDVAAIYDAVNHPDNKGMSIFWRNHCLAFVGQNGDVAMFVITTPSILGSAITFDRSSKKLGPTLRAAEARALVPKLALNSPVQSVAYHDLRGSRDVTPSVSRKNRRLLQDLLGCYSPLALKGNELCKSEDVQKFARRVPIFLVVKLTKADEFDAIVAQKKTDWETKTFDTSLRLQRVSFDTITIFRQYEGYALFAFTDSKSNKCLFTNPVISVTPLKVSRPVSRRGPVYGPDLFNQMISAMKGS